MFGGKKSIEIYISENQITDSFNIIVKLVMIIQLSVYEPYILTQY